MATEERKAQLEFEVANNTQAGVDSIKSSLEGIGTTANLVADQASKGLDGLVTSGKQAAQGLDRVSQGIASSIKRQISDTQRQIAALQAEASGGGQANMFENLVRQRGADAKALQPLISALRDTRSEFDLMAAAQKRTEAANLFEQQHQAAKKLVQDSEYVRMWTDALQKKEAAERASAGQNSFIASLKAQSDAIGKTRADLLELQAAQLGVSEQAAPYVARLRQQEQALNQGGKALNAYGQTAKATSAALRQVPAQITDIFVSLQGGQAPLTVLLQQGGQLKDVFGGIVPAARALGSTLLTYVLNPVVLVAGGVAALTLAYNQGSKEADAYNKALVLTGNAAGTTSARLAATAAEVSSFIGTQGQAAEAVAALAGTGSVASQNIARYAEVAIRSQKFLGISVKDTAKEFNALGETPVEALVKLNKEYNFLTAAVYDQVRALRDQGKEQEAATLAQNTYADAMSSRSNQLEGQLGSIERGWRAITSAAKEGWDAMLGIGRAENPQDEIKRLQEQIERRAQRAELYGDTDAPDRRVKDETELSRLRALLILRQSELGIQEEQAAVDAEGIKRENARRQVSDLIYEGRTKAVKLKDEEIALQAKLNKGYIDEVEYNKALVVLREKYKETPKRGDERADQARQAELADLRAKIKAETEYTERLREQGIQAEKNTAGLRLADKIEEELRGKLDAKTRAHKEQTLALAQQLDAATKVRVEEQERAKAIAKSEEAMRKQVQAVYDDATATEQQRLKIDETTEAYGKSAIAVAKLAVARTQLRLAEAEGSDNFDPAYVANLRRQLDEQTRLVGSMQVAEYKKVTRALEEQIVLGKEQNELAMLEADLIGLTEVERRKILVAREQELKLAKELREIDQSGLTDTQKESARQLARERNRIDSINATNKVILDDWQKTADSINNSLTDALLRGFESGKDFAKNLRDTVVNMFKTMVLRPVIQAIIAPISGGILGSLGLGGGGAGGGAGGLLNLASNASSAYRGYGLLSQYLGGGSAGASAISLGYANTVGALGGDSIGALISANGGWAGVGAPYSAANAAATAMPAGFGAGAGGGIGALGAAGIFAGIALAIGNAFGVFREDRKVGGGLRGTLGGGTLQPWEEWREGGTLFSGPEYSTMNPLEALERERARLAELRAARDNGTLGNPQQLATQQTIVDKLEADYGGLADSIKAQSKVIQDAYDAMRNSVGDMADVLGLSSDKVREFTTELGGSAGLNFEGLKPEEIQAKINEALATANNELAQQVIGEWEKYVETDTQVISANVGTEGEDRQVVYDEITTSTEKMRYVASEYAREGEKAIDTLTRLATSLSTVNNIWDSLGYDLIEASLAGGDFASMIVDAFGGIENMRAATSSYLENFYSQDEQREAVRRQLQRQLDTVDLKLPDINAEDARAQFRALAEAQDLSTEEGRKAYAMLLSLASAYAGVTQSAEGERDRLEKDQRDKAFRALERAIAAEKELIQVRLDAANDLKSELEGLFGLLRENVRDLLGEVEPTRQLQAQQGRSFIDQALVAARATGYLPDQTELADAIAAARGDLEPARFSTQFDLDSERLRLAASLGELRDLTGEQLSDTERMIAELTEQSDQLDKTLSYWRDQIDIANGTYEATLSVTEAINRLISLTFPEVGSTRPEQVGGGFVVGGGNSDSSPAPSRPVYGDLNDTERVFTGSYVRGLEWGTPDADAKSTRELADYAAANGISQRDLADVLGFTPEQIAAHFSQYNIPAFEVGTNYVPRNMLAFLHEGEAVVPKPYNPFANPSRSETQSSASAAALESRMVQMQDDTRRVADKTLELQGRMNRVLDKWDTEGLPKEREEANV